MYQKKVRSRAPLRLAMAGAGTDLSPYCDEHTGYVLNATIDRYAYCTLETCDNNHVVLSVSDSDRTCTLRLEEYPFPLTGEFVLLKATYNKIISEYNGNRPVPVKLSTFCDSPIGAGLGTLASIVVCVIKAFEEYLSFGFDDYEIAQLAYEIERVDCKLQGGRQDHYSATLGGFNFMEFYGDNRVLVNPLRIRSWIRCELESSMLLHYIGASQTSTEVIENQIQRVSEESTLAIDNMHRIKASALHMKEAILRGDFASFVEYMNIGWESKRLSAADVSNSIIDDTVTIAKNAGALCAKISGAGGGGFIMYFVPPEKRQNVITALKSCGGWVSNCHFAAEGSECWTI